jgi:DsbC/DsbD-like thiol-disulfide interchange protein
MEEGWHTYWKNPGDSGLPTTIKWNLPEGFSAGEIQWPCPQKFETSGIVSFGYGNEVFLLMDMQVPAEAKPGTVARFSASVDWLACKEECVTEHADLIIEIPVESRDSKVDLKWTEYFNIFRNSLPKSAEDWNINASASGEIIIIRALSEVSLNKASIDIFFFSEESGVVDHSEPQKVKKLRNGYLIEIKRSRFSQTLPSRLKGVFFSTQGWDASGKNHTLSDYAGKIIVLEWLNHGCPFVQKHYNSGNMQKLQKMAKENGVVWFSIISSAPGKQGYSTPEQANETAREKNAQPLVILLDPEGKVGRLYDAKTTPHMYIIDKDGILVYNGGIDDIRSANIDDIAKANNYVLLALEELLSGKEVLVKASQPYGCSVKYKN